ncbi:ABC transporter permease [Desulfosediminicola flagellatus]|uniref:ABC transporter permease n=1 Tax=Desulfosediminicola flagellatus TaxID=2569541 RepID=UPI001C3E7FE5|nr:ABC transporter permease [Desulfosediminicola flagellatus]
MSKEHMVKKNQQWDLVIKPKTGWFDIDFKELWQFRDLIGMFVKRDFLTFYKQTILGPLWYIIQPLVTTVIFTIIFGRVAKISTDGLPPFLFYMAGNVMWGYFAATLNATAGTFNTNSAIFGKVYFPRLSVPIATVIVNFLQFFIQLALFFGFYVYFMAQGANISPSLSLIGLPVLLLQMALLSFGLGIFLSSLTTKYKDLKFAMGFLIQLWMYGTPVVYPLSQIPEWLLPYYVLNPMVAIVESFRFGVFGTSALTINHIIISWFVTLLLLGCGVLLFSRIEKSFMDTV